MGIKIAVVKRLESICIEKNLSFNSLATISGVTPSTVYSLMSSSRKDISIVTLKKLCDGLNISLSEFFDDDIFEQLEQEIC